jgi:hypothetical protein
LYSPRPKISYKEERGRKEKENRGGDGKRGGRMEKNI